MGRQFAVALGFAMIAGGLAGLLYEKRDSLFEWDWRRARGKLEARVPPALVIAAREWAEGRRKGEACVVNPLARDEVYLYAAVGCGKFRGAGVEGDAAPLAARFRARGDTVTGMERAPVGTYRNSVRRLFPQEVFEKMRYGFPHEEYLRAGQARMREMGGSQ